MVRPRPRRRRAAMTLGLGLASAACGGGGRGVATATTIENTAGADNVPVAADSATCDPVLSALVERVVGGQLERPRQTQFADDLVTLCVGDRWSLAAVACLKRATAQDDTLACARHLTDAQQFRLDKVLQGTFGVGLVGLGVAP